MGHRTAPPPLQSAQELDLSICQFVFLFVFGTAAKHHLQWAQELDLSICLFVFLSICLFVFLFVFGTDLLHTLCCLYLAETFDLSILLHLTLCLRKEFLMQE